MPSPMCALACGDPAYQTALNAKGFSLTDKQDYAGKQYSHDEIAAMFDDSYRKHRPEFAIVCGGKPRVNKKRDRQFHRAIKTDVWGSFGISPWTILFGVIALLLGGPMGLVVAIVICLFEYYLTKDLEGDQAMMVSMGCA